MLFFHSRIKNFSKNFDKIKSLLDNFHSLSLIQDETINERISKISNTVDKIGSYSSDFESFAKRFNNIKNLTPLNKLPSLEDVANIVGFLCSDENTGMTNQFITVDKGFSNARII